MLGGPRSLVLLVLLAGGAFVLVVTLTARRFLAGTQESLSDPGTVRSTDAIAPVRFRAGLLRTVIVKEWRLVIRDPQLIAQTLLPTLYLLPLVFIGAQEQSVTAFLAPAAVMATAMLASGLVWLTVAAEDAPELIASAPVDLARVRHMKLLAALAPVWIIVSPLAVFFALSSLWTALVFGTSIAGRRSRPGSYTSGYRGPGTGATCVVADKEIGYVSHSKWRRR